MYNLQNNFYFHIHLYFLEFQKYDSNHKLNSYEIDHLLGHNIVDMMNNMDDIFESHY